jgi:chloramphenicol-sensitive protein RarD
MTGPEASRGLAYACGAYVLWGLLPLYFRQIAAVPAFEVVVHRAFWSVVLVLVLLAALRRLGTLGEAFRQPRLLGVAALNALLLSGNWLLYVWAVNHGHVLDASLGYFINPLVNVSLGVLLLHERLRRMQWATVALAAAGVAWLTWQAGQLPWIALVLAVSFGIYGLLRKTAPVGAIEGFALETLLLAAPAATLLGWWTWRGASALAGGDAGLVAWLLLAGPVTALPLILFAAGARRLPLATMGLLQYISPSLQFALGVWVFDEPFGGTRLTGFALIWMALLVYSAEAFAARLAPAAARAAR